MLSAALLRDDQPSVVFIEAGHSRVIFKPSVMPKLRIPLLSRPGRWACPERSQRIEQRWTNLWHSSIL